MKKRTIITVATLIGLIVTACVLNVYLTDFYYKKPRYTFGTRNSTQRELHNVTARLFPQGEDRCGILVPGQEKDYMDPRWPVPERIVVTFSEDQGVQHELNVVTGLPGNFRGKLTIVIIETNDNFAAKLEKIAEN
jgi:hypothetical protein